MSEDRKETVGRVCVSWIKISPQVTEPYTSRQNLATNLSHAETSQDI